VLLTLSIISGYLWFDWFFTIPLLHSCNHYSATRLLRLLRIKFPISREFSFCFDDRYFLCYYPLYSPLRKVNRLIYSLRLTLLSLLYNGIIYSKPVSSLSSLFDSAKKARIFFNFHSLFVSSLSWLVLLLKLLLFSFLSCNDLFSAFIEWMVIFGFDLMILPHSSLFSLLSITIQSHVITIHSPIPLFNLNESGLDFYLFSLFFLLFQ